MNNNTARVSLVIPIFNNYFALLDLIDSVLTSTFSHWKHIEIIFVNDASTLPKPGLLVAKLNSLTCAHKWIDLESNQGPAIARNTGVAHATGTYIVFFDADVSLHKHTLANAYDFFTKKKGQTFTGIWDKSQLTTSFFPQFKALRDYAYWFIEREQDARYYLFSTRVAGIEKKLFDKIGGFNTTYKKATVEDIELTYKIEQHTKISFEPTIIVHHEFEEFVPLAKKYFARSRDWIKLYMKRLRFDPVATSKQEAHKSLVCGMSVISFFLAVLFSAHIFVVYSIFSTLYYLYLDAPFLKFLKKEKGLLFTLNAIPTTLALYTVINIGSAVGMLEYIIKKIRTR